MNKNILIVIVVSLFVFGCSTTQKKFPDEKINLAVENYQSFLIVPTGDIVVSSNSTYYNASSISGAISAVLLNSRESNKMETYQRQRATSYSIYKSGGIDEEVQEVIKSKLIDKSSGKVSIRVNELTSKNLSFNEWYETNKREDFQKINNPNKSLIIEYGLENIKLYTNLINESYVEGGLGVRVIDPISGIVIARTKVHSINFLDVVKEKVELDGVDENSTQYIEATKKAYKKLFNVLTNRAISQIGI